MLIVRERKVCANPNFISELVLKKTTPLLTNVKVYNKKLHLVDVFRKNGVLVTCAKVAKMVSLAS